MPTEEQLKILHENPELLLWDIERRDESTYKMVFADDTVITVISGVWDHGYRDCWCWESTGHLEDCPKHS